MSITTVSECSECGISGDTTYVGPCSLCGEPVCTNCAGWISTKNESFGRIYFDVIRICQKCRPTYW